MPASSIHPARGFLVFFLAALASLGSSLLADLVLQAFNTLPVPDHPEFFRLFFGSSLVLGPALWYLVAESRYHGVRLLGLTLVVYIGAAQIMAHIETVVYNFLFQFTAGQILFLVASQGLAALLFVPLILTLAGKWKAPQVPVEDRVGEWLPQGGGFWMRLALLSVLWYFTYMLAGYFIADPITHRYYEAKMAGLSSINAWLPLVQLVRGLLWTLLFLLAVRLMNRPLGESGLVAGLLFGVFHAAGLLLPNASMPDEMRLSHLPEIVLSLVWQGCLTVAVFRWRRPASRRDQKAEFEKTPAELP